MPASFLCTISPPHALKQAKHASAEYTFTEGKTTYQAVTPGDLATIYNLNPLFAAGVTGAGQTIAVIEDSDLYSTTDWSTFRSTFGLTKYTSGTLDDGSSRAGHRDEQLPRAGRCRR